ncbi:G2/M phase-specific E3 ubiquitin-protein ligase [Triplophysa tibetana]|uniref:G2/M phase-specific E3 ubiquitin-protein ligase n=1 Tax=Triplophysa tibetana TaxID=1572043 RepID=A0A5A9NQH9_9TELE|nr:G2/M phase-specific E3 ubiquitin-protein ligase [Triplophysa tibetana]
MKAIQEESTEIKEMKHDKDLICSLCKRSDNCLEKYGEKITLEQHKLTVHYICLLVSSGVFQRGEEHEGIHGFLVNDIKKEIRRSSKLKCTHCKKHGASVGCFIRTCRQMVHMPCGIEQEFIFQFTDSFPSYCKKHAPIQTCVSSPSLPLSCSVCLEPIEPVLSYNVLKCPACHGSWFHRACVQQYAHSAAMFFCKCTLCNNKDQFQQEMIRMGIYIPERDASWELEENAFGELLQVYQQCDASKCLSQKGRKHCTLSGVWEIIRCMLCGSRGTHRRCSSLKFYETDWTCAECKAAVEEKNSVTLPNYTKSPLAERQERKRLFKGCISNLHPSLISKRQCLPATSTEILMGLACQISQQQCTEVLVEDGNDDEVVKAALAVCRQSDFNPCYTLSVKFSKDKLNNKLRNQRWFLRHLVYNLQTSEIFGGPDGAKNLVLNSRALRDDLYFEVGSLLAISLVHGGPLVSFFSPALYHSLFSYPKDYRPTLQDLGDNVLAHKIRRIADANSISQMRSAMLSAREYLEAAGCWRKVSKLSEKDMLVEDVLSFYLIIRLQLPLQRFREGLRTLGVFEQVQMCAESFYSVFCGPVERMTAKSILELFTIRFSEEEDLKAKENTAINFWEQYLHECEEGQCATSIEDILTFATATDTVPAIGFNTTPTLSFLDSPDPTFGFPQSHSVNHLILPILPSYEVFKKHLDYAVCQFSVMQYI